MDKASTFSLKDIPALKGMLLEAHTAAPGAPVAVPMIKVDVAQLERQEFHLWKARVQHDVDV
eukprot:150336-Lingulodinium_polyedra.AAC.1